MKKIFIGAVFILGSFIGQAQDSTQTVTVKTILDTYFENIGGREAWSKLTSYRFTAKVNAQGMEIPITVINQKDGKTMTKFSLQGQEMVQGSFDGESMWSTNFMTQKAEKSSSEDTENYKRSIGEFPDALLTYDSLGYQLELEGEETKEGVECYKLKMTKKKQLVEGEEKDNIVYYYFDKENFVPIMTEEQILSGEMTGKKSQMLYSDYQEISDGMYYPFSLTSQVEGIGGQTIEITEIEINVEIDQTMFNFPEN
ncbi:MAG: outer membrane lipoprotein-sorting protein [Crocinitomicaceae bacterium]|nr:outer membrane lipoprotein-sorting protein [Crocinitomicaceae bacterium]